ncbi:hypothetical protein D3C80_2067740 [compost metagenome]
MIATVGAEVHGAVRFPGDLQAEDLSGVATRIIQVRGTQAYVSNVMQVDHEVLPRVYFCLDGILALTDK